MASRGGGAATGGGFDPKAASAVVPVGSVQWLIEVMVACLVFYDRASLPGMAHVFESREVQIKKCVASIKKCGGPGTTALCNSLKYATLHYDDASASIQRALE
mmetsp:Transcript_43953/g.88867  ORF Transcript_43953/g.88867 Transcript_43953/m.88867 type:complete len:103 (+) Transcript_43953:1-309(+)